MIGKDESIETNPEWICISKIRRTRNMADNKTYDNLMAAFAGESQANRKYLAYSKQAEKDGNLNAAKLFKAASDAETLHALKHFEVAGKIGTTADNLKDAVAGETYEYIPASKAKLILSNWLKKKATKLPCFLSTMR